MEWNARLSTILKQNLFSQQSTFCRQSCNELRRWNFFLTSAASEVFSQFQTQGIKERPLFLSITVLYLLLSFFFPFFLSTISSLLFYPCRLPFVLNITHDLPFSLSTSYSVCFFLILLVLSMLVSCFSFLPLPSQSPLPHSSALHLIFFCHSSFCDFFSKS
jgi:hypothetical protein